jgi:peptide/nickel transport system permease protein
MLGTDAPKEQIDSLRKELWLDRPFFIQSVWLFNALQGDLGTSVYYKESVVSVFGTSV